MSTGISYRPARPADRERICALLRRRWGSARMAIRGRLLDPSAGEAFLAETTAGELVGLITLRIEDEICEVASLDSLRENQGIGGALLQHAAHFAAERGCRRLRLITSNDNLNALRFYQKRGLRITAVFPDAITRARAALKPEIPLTGEHGIPIRDEIELELPLAPPEAE